MVVISYDLEVFQEMLAEIKEAKEPKRTCCRQQSVGLSGGFLWPES